MDNPLPNRKPPWLKVQANTGQENIEVMSMLRKLNLHTVCEEAGCPNCGECFGKRTATFMILGNNCTRNCRFCTVLKGEPLAVDELEPQHIAQAVKALNLRHVVITSVTRDDLPDGGSAHFAAVIAAIKQELKEKAPVIEVLIPDFKGDYAALKTVIAAKPAIINHNIETIKRLYPTVRPMADYEQSLELISRVKQIDPSITTKSGIMVGLGERFEEVECVFRDLRSSHCELLTVGQYLAPSKLHIPVVEYVPPQVFEDYKKSALAMGFLFVASAPLVRSSYMAENAYEEILRRK